MYSGSKTNSYTYKERKIIRLIRGKHFNRVVNELPATDYSYMILLKINGMKVNKCLLQEVH